LEASLGSVARPCIKKRKKREKKRRKKRKKDR
jgi:hypothetical protein